MLKEENLKVSNFEVGQNITHDDFFNCNKLCVALVTTCRTVGSGTLKGDLVGVSAGASICLVSMNCILWEREESMLT